MLSKEFKIIAAILMSIVLFYLVFLVLFGAFGTTTVTLKTQPPAIQTPLAN